MTRRLEFFGIGKRAHMKRLSRFVMTESQLGPPINSATPLEHLCVRISAASSHAMTIVRGWVVVRAGFGCPICGVETSMVDQHGGPEHRTGIIHETRNGTHKTAMYKEPTIRNQNACKARLWSDFHLNYSIFVMATHTWSSRTSSNV